MPIRLAGTNWIAVAALVLLATLVFFVAQRLRNDALADEMHERWVKPGADAQSEELWRRVDWRNDHGGELRYSFPPIAAPYVARLNRESSADVGLESPWAQPLIEFLSSHERELDVVTAELLAMDPDRDGHASPPVAEHCVADLLRARAVLQAQGGDQVGAERSLEAAYIAEPWDTSEPFAPVALGCLRRVRPSDPMWLRRLEAFDPLATWDAQVAETISGRRGEWQWDPPNLESRLASLEMRLPFTLSDGLRQNVIDVFPRRRNLRDLDEFLERLSEPSNGCVTEALLAPVPREGAAHTAYGLQYWRIAALREIADITLTRAVLQAEQGPGIVTSTTCPDIQVEITRVPAGWTCTLIGSATRLCYDRSGPASYTLPALAR